MKNEQRTVRMWSRLTQGQADYIAKVANESYRTPQQVVQMLLDQAILADGYHRTEPTPLRKEATDA